MFGLGTIINTLAVAAGSLVGIFFKKGIKDSVQNGIMKCCGLATIFIGTSGVMQYMLIVSDGHISTQGSMLLIFSLIIGTVIGELIDIEKRMDNIGERLKKLFKAEGDNKFVDGFVNCSLVICVGAMAIVGSMQDGMSGDFSMLAAKAVLDFLIVIVFAAMYGVGVTCSAIPIFVYQGLITLAAHFAGNFIGDELMSQLSFVGNALIFCVGINICFDKKFRVGNMLPALIVPVIYSFFV